MTPQLCLISDVRQLKVPPHRMAYLSMTRKLTEPQPGHGKRRVFPCADVQRIAKAPGRVCEGGTVKMPFGKCQDEELEKIASSYLYCGSEAGSLAPSKRRWTRDLPETSQRCRTAMTETAYGPFTVRDPRMNVWCGWRRDASIQGRSTDQKEIPAAL
jgi:hypothetical protein